MSIVAANHAGRPLHKPPRRLLVTCASRLVKHDRKPGQHALPAGRVLPHRRRVYKDALHPDITQERRSRLCITREYGQARPESQSIGRRLPCRRRRHRIGRRRHERRVGRHRVTSRHRSHSAIDPIELRVHLSDRCTRALEHLNAADAVNSAAHLDLSLAVHQDARTRRRVHRAGHLRPALGHVLGRIRTGRRANLEHVPGTDIRIERDRDLVAPAIDQRAHRHTLVAGALEAHELNAGAAAQIGIGEAAVERHAEAPFAGASECGIECARRAGIERRAVGRDHVVDVIGILHAALDLEGRDAGGHELVHMLDAAVIARTQQAVQIIRHKRGSLRILQVIRHAAGLGAVAPVGGSPAPHGRKSARARIADADSPVAKDLHGQPRPDHGLDLVHRKLARDGHALDRKLARNVCRARRGHHTGLCGQMDLNTGNLATQQIDKAGIRHDQGIGACGERRARELERRLQLLLAQVHVAGHVNAHAACVRKANRSPKHRGIYIRRARTGVEGAQAAVHGIGPGRHGGKECIERAGGRQQFGKRFGHRLKTPSCWYAVVLEYGTHKHTRGPRRTRCGILDSMYECMLRKGINYQRGNR